MPIHYEVAGQGRPIVLLHSFLCSGEMWREQVPALAVRFRVINIDLRGHGASGEVTRRCSIYDMVEDVCRVLDDAGEASAIWAGLSIGGMISMRAALAAPDRVDALLLLDTEAAAERPFNRIKYRVMGGVARTLGFGPLRGQISRQMFGAATMRERGPLVEEWSRRFAELHVPSILWMVGALVTRDDVTPRLREIAVPSFLDTLG